MKDKRKVFFLFSMQLCLQYLEQILIFDGCQFDACMPDLSFCPISLGMCGHTYVSKTKAENDREKNKRARLNEERIK